MGWGKPASDRSWPWNGNEWDCECQSEDDIDAGVEFDKGRN